MVGYAKITQNFKSLVLDGVTKNPETVNGRVIFRPLLPRGSVFRVKESSDVAYTIPTAEVECQIIDGKIYKSGILSVYLFAGGPGSTPESVSWVARYEDVVADGEPVTLPPLYFKVLPGALLDLSRGAFDFAIEVHENGLWTLTGSDDNIKVSTDGEFVVNGIRAVNNNDGTYTIFDEWEV